MTKKHIQRNQKQLVTEWLIFSNVAIVKYCKAVTPLMCAHRTAHIHFIYFILSNIKPFAHRQFLHKQFNKWIKKEPFNISKTSNFVNEECSSFSMSRCLKIHRCCRCCCHRINSFTRNYFESDRAANGHFVLFFTFCLCFITFILWQLGTSIRMPKLTVLIQVHIKFRISYVYTYICCI